MKPIFKFLNNFPIKWWIIIYLLILGSHVFTLLNGYTLSSLGFLLSVVTYYILLSKSKSWTKTSLFSSLLMFLIFLVISLLLQFTELIKFYEICFLIGVYELVLMFLFFKIPMKHTNEIDFKRLNFIRNLLSIILLTATLYYIPLGTYGIYKHKTSENISGFIYPLYLIAVLIVLMSFILINIFSNHKNNNQQNINIVLTERDQIDIKTINNFFLDSEIYLSYNFSIDDLSSQTGIERKRLSYLINKGMGINYYKLVAYHRINNAKKIIELESAYTLEYIASQCGFTSTSIFIKYFKEFVGVTPKKYQNKFNKQN